ncbi:MAG: hypothetical protein AAB739_01080 [Patescibacteria group bacterium]
MNTNLDTFGDAFYEIRAGLKTPVLVTSKRDDILRPLFQTVIAVSGLEENTELNETVLQAVLQRKLPSHIKQLIKERLAEAGISN